MEVAAVLLIDSRTMCVFINMLIYQSHSMFHNNENIFYKFVDVQLFFSRDVSAPWRSFTIFGLTRYHRIPLYLNCIWRGGTTDCLVVVECRGLTYKSREIISSLFLSQSTYLKPSCKQHLVCNFGFAIPFVSTYINRFDIYFSTYHYALFSIHLALTPPW